MSAPPLGSAQVVQGDALALDLPDESVDLIVTSPPYFALRSYQDGGEHYDGQIGSEPTPQQFLDALWRVMSSSWRVLKPEGSCWVNLGDKYAGSGGHNNGGLQGASSAMGERAHTRARDAVRKASRRNAPDRYSKASGGVRGKSLIGIPWRFANGCIDGLGAPCTKIHDHVGRHSAYLPSEQCEGARWILRAEVIWKKSNGLPESVSDRVRRNHEHWFHFTKQPRYFSSLDAIRESHNKETIARRMRGRKHVYVPPGQTVHTGLEQALNPLGKLPGSVWTIATEPLKVPKDIGVDHFAAFPTEWPRKIIEAWCPIGGTVLDPFGGTGTTAMVAKALGRNGISVDLSADYCRLAEWRTNDNKQIEKIRIKTYGTLPKKPAKAEAVPVIPGQVPLFNEAVS